MATTTQDPKKKSDSQTGPKKQTTGPQQQTMGPQQEVDPKTLQQEQKNKTRKETAQADLTEAKAQEQQIKTSLLKQQAAEQGAPLGAPSPLASTLGQLQGAPRGPAMDPMQAELQRLSTGTNPSLDQRAIAQLQQLALSQSQDPSTQVMQKWMNQKAERSLELTEKIDALKQDTPTFLESALGALSLGIYDPSNDAEVASLSQERNILDRNLSGIASTLVSGAAAGKRQLASQGFGFGSQQISNRRDFQRQIQLQGLQSVLSEAQRDKNFRSQMQLQSIANTDKVKADKVKFSQQLEIQAKQNQFTAQRDKLKVEAEREKIELAMAGKDTTEGPKHKELESSNQGMRSQIVAVNQMAGNYDGLKGKIFNTMMAQMESNASKGDFEAVKAIDDLVNTASSAEMVIQGLKQIGLDMAGVTARNLQQETARVGAADRTFFEKGINDMSSTANLFLKQLEAAATDRMTTLPKAGGRVSEAQVLNKEGELVSAISENAMLHAYLEDNKLMAVPGNAAASAEVLATGKFPNGESLQDAGIRRRAEERGVWNNPIALKRRSSASIGERLTRQKLQTESSAEATGFMSMMRTKLNSISGTGGKFSRGFTPHRLKGFPTAGILMQMSDSDILWHVRNKTALKKNSEFNILEKFQQYPKIRKALLELGWTDTNALRKKFDKQF